MEPFKYFELVKKSLNITQHEDLLQVENAIKSEIDKAMSLNQIVLANDLIFTTEVISKELIAIDNGFNSYIDRSLLHKFLDNVTDRSVIKACELERYPRIIPHENALIIKQAQSLNIFDKYMVIFTDLVDSVSASDEDKEYIERNKDPIVLGYFHKPENNNKYDKFYLITDWIDDHCDLTFDKMIREIASSNIEPKYKEQYQHNISKDNLKEHVKNRMNEIYGRNFIKTNKVSFIDKLKGLFK